VTAAQMAVDDFGGKVLGKPVSVVEVPLAAVVPQFTGMGFSEDIAKLFQEMYEGILDGTVAFDGTGEHRKGTVTPQEVLGNLLKAEKPAA